MGIKPNFIIVIGIDDVVPNDPRRDYRDRDTAYEIVHELPPAFYVPDDERHNLSDRDPEHRKLIYGREWEWLDDILYNVLQPGEYVCGNVVGMIIDNGHYDSSIWRAFAAIDSKYMEAGSMRIPTLDPQEHSIHFQRNGYNDDDVSCNRFVDSVFENMPGVSRMLWKRARYYLSQAGWTIPETELRYLLVWDWG